MRWISEGAFTIDDNQTIDAERQQSSPITRSASTLTDTKLHNVPPGFRLVPGMTLSGDIHIGTRSLFMYLMQRRRCAASTKRCASPDGFDGRKPTADPVSAQPAAAVAPCRRAAAARSAAGGATIGRAGLDRHA